MSAMGGAEWFFVEQDPNDRVRSTTRRHALEGSGLPTVERVVREAVQNSVDATLENEMTVVEFSVDSISGERAADFAALLRLDANGSPLKRLNKLGLQANNSFARLGKPSPDSVGVTIVSDYNTLGLGFDDKDGVDRFEELCLSFGQDTTDASAARGGSYGFGKEVYEEASDCNMFIAYSVFEPSAMTHEKGCRARLFGCATFDGHEWNDENYKGRALFGRVEKDTRGRKLSRPLIDEDAHIVAERLGFELRGNDEPGTSIMIVGARLDIDGVREAVEKYWWPRIQANRLSVGLIADGKELAPPEPKTNSALDPFIDCYQMIDQETKPTPPRERKHTLNALHGLKPGLLALKALDSDADRDDDDDPLANTVALIRSGPKMVVEYMRPGGLGRGYVGAFVSHPDVEKSLHLSEPPSHDSWNENSQRIEDAYASDPDMAETARDIVRRIMRRVKSYARDFGKSLAPPPPVVPTSGSREMRRILSAVMSSGGLGSPPPPPRRLIHLLLRLTKGARTRDLYPL